MYLDRRGFLRLGLGGAVTVALSAVAPLIPTDAYAIAGVDDAVVGALVLAMMGLAGYTVSTALTSTSLASMGYSFSEFAQDVSNQQAAVTRALADANNLGVQVERQRAEDAAAAIAAGTGAFGDWISGVASSGRAAIDGWLGGVGANQAALWGLLAEYVATELGVLSRPAAGAKFFADESYSFADTGIKCYVMGLSELLALYPDVPVPSGVLWAVGEIDQTGHPRLWTGDGMYPVFRPADSWGDSYSYIQCTEWSYDYPTNKYKPISRQSITCAQRYEYYFSSDILVGPMLPGVDKAPECPETLGAGYSMTPIGADAVVGQDGTITNSGSIAVPIGVALPGVDVPYSQGLYGLDAGVVSGLRSLPYSAELTDAWVGTPEGVVSMPITQALEGSTSIGATVEPSVPVVPPGTPDVGPWTPAYNLPFYDVWPFNLVYSFVSELSTLGGA